MSYLGIEGYHAFVTGARGGIGSAIVDELVAAGCNVTAHDLKPPHTDSRSTVFHVQGDISDEASIKASIAEAVAKHGPINILCANAGITNEQNHPSIWELDLQTWEAVYAVNVRGTFLTIKHFLLAAKSTQEERGNEIDNLAIVVTGSECGKFGQAGHAEYASGKAGLQYGLVPTVKNEMVRLNSKGRINAVMPGWVDTELIGDRLDDPRELYFESQGTVALRKIAKPVDVAKAVAFLASHRASGHISGQALSVDGGMEGRIVWREEEILPKRSGPTGSASHSSAGPALPTIPRTISKPPTIGQSKLKIALSLDFDAISSWLGTGKNPENTLSDYSAGTFSATMGVPRILRVLKSHSLESKVTWCIPGHTIETFPTQCDDIAATGAEIALHGYAHEAASQMTAEQEEDVLKKCVHLIEDLARRNGNPQKTPVGYRAPLYKLSERTIELLERYNFSWDSSLAHFHSTPYLLPKSPVPPIEPIDFRPDVKAETWMHPSVDITKLPLEKLSRLVEIPGNWYEEDATPLQYYPNVPNSHGYVDVKVIEEMWRARFEWLLREMDEDAAEGKEETKVFGLCLHPEVCGMAHIIGMIDRFIGWIQSERNHRVEWVQFHEIAAELRRKQEVP